MIRYAEFCTGIGGFRLGIEKSSLNAKLVYSNEIDVSCETTYAANFKHGFDSKDLFDVIPSSLPDFDMICAGFPCQPFSQAGHGKGFEDPRGTVFFKLLDIIKEKKPQIVFFENVPNLKSHDKGNTFRVIQSKLEDAGYNLNIDILDSTFFGVPQSRPRIYIVGFKKELGEMAFSFTKKVTEKTMLRKFLNLGDYSIPISPKWQEYIDLYTNKKTAEEISFPLPKTRVALERVAANCNLDDCVFQIRSSGIRAYSLDEPFPTFAVSNSGGGAMIPVLSKERRHLNLIEMRRLMGFPEWYDLTKVSRTDAIKQLANAVCPPVIESICNDINRAIARN
ncbi:MAG TPA: DNA (cytosine-5-)-methyltransferase [Clostridiales bacterium UBA9856]|nr:DNA (cytosine-5-)-methyltransferase [Clostridiales bacterium UBA9856]